MSSALLFDRTNDSAARRIELVVSTVSKTKTLYCGVIVSKESVTEDPSPIFVRVKPIIEESIATVAVFAGTLGLKTRGCLWY